MSDEVPLNEIDGPIVPPVSPTLRKRLQKCFDHGQNLMQQDKYDHDYANTMFTECVANDPGNPVYLDAFLENLQRKYNNKKKGGKLLGFGGGKGNLKKLAGKDDWQGVIVAGLALLKGNPWDVPVLRAIAEACEALHLNEVELRYLKNALVAKPKDPEVNRHCARSLGRMGQYDMAIACWHRVEEGKRNDREAAQAISDLTLEKNRASAGFGTAVELPSSPVNPKAVADGENSNEATRKNIDLTPRQKLEQSIIEDATVAENYIELAKVLLGESRYGEAEKVLNRGLDASGGDVKLREALEDVQMVRARQQVAIAKKRATEGGSEEEQQLAAKMEKDLVQRELEIYHARAERYPDNQKLKYEFAIRLKRVGKLEQAIKSLAEAAKDARIASAAQVEMGMCLQQQKEYQQAMQAYRSALKGDHEPPVEIKKKALYLAGRLAIGLKDHENGRKYLQEVHDLDPHYRDTGELLDKL